MDPAIRQSAILHESAGSQMTHHHSEHDPFPTETTLAAGEDRRASEITGGGQTIPETITVLLSRINHGDRDAFDELVPLVYHELHRIADGYLRRESRNHTLQPTALIHEAWLRLAGSTGADYQNRKHFYATAAKVMRRILVDHARARATGKRDANLTVALEAFDMAPAPDRIVISLDDALNALAAQDERKARLVEMRFFGGMTAEEIAECTATPVHVVRRELRAAQIWLRREIGV